MCGAVQTGEQEFRALSPEELKACQDGCKPGGCKVTELDKQLLQQLYKKGLIHLDVPIRPNDHVSIPPLEVRPTPLHSAAVQSDPPVNGTCLHVQLVP